MPYVFRATTSVFLAIPAFFTALIGLLVFGLHYGIAPIIGYEPAFPANLKYLWLPALVICTTLVPVLARVLHSSILETMSEEFVESGIVRGLGRLRLYWFYLLKPSLAPTIVLLSYMVGVMIGSTVIIETIFSLPGIGRNLVGAVIGRDYPVVQGIVLVFGLFVVAVGLVGDICRQLARPADGRVVTVSAVERVEPVPEEGAKAYRGGRIGIGGGDRHAGGDACGRCLGPASQPVPSQ